MNGSDRKLATPGWCLPSSVVEVSLDVVHEIVVRQAGLAWCGEAQSEHKCHEAQDQESREDDRRSEDGKEKALLLRNHLDVGPSSLLLDLGCVSDHFGFGGIWLGLLGRAGSV